MKIRKCRHKWFIEQRSNALQLDDMGYPLRLCIVRCSKCGKSDQQWIDVDRDLIEELNMGESFLLRWK